MRFVRRRGVRRDDVARVDIGALPRALPEEQVRDAIARARRLTTRPLEAVGAGMTAIVFCDDRGRAYKVARHPHSSESIADEADWLRTANQVPGLRARVARLYGFHRHLDILIRECPKSVEDAYRRRKKLYELWQEIGARISPYGWGPPEFKEDSFVITRSGPVLVDAGFAYHLGRRQLAYVQDILTGKRPKPRNDSWADLAFSLRREVTEKTLRPQHVRPTIERLVRLDPQAKEWMV